MSDDILNYPGGQEAVAEGMQMFYAGWLFGATRQFLQNFAPSGKVEPIDPSDEGIHKGLIVDLGHGIKLRVTITKEE